jgi:MFS family permease
MLAIVMTSSSIATLFVQPIVGAFSDRTRSRMGRRSPYIVIGGAAGGLFLIGLQGLSSILWITVFWVLAQVCLNSLQGPVSTLVSDRFETSSRATASAFLGVGTAVGGTFGVVIAGQLLDRLGVGYTIFGMAIIVAAVLFVLTNREYPTKDQPKVTIAWGAFFRSFWVSPRKHPDYGWAFGGRFVMILGYQGIQAYQLYILKEYIGLSDQEAGAFAGTLALITMVTLTTATLIAGKFSDTLGRRKIFVFASSVVMAGALAFPLISPTTTGMIAYAIVVGLGYGVYMAVDMALMVDVLPSSGDAGKDLGVLNVATNIPQAITPVLAAGLLGIFDGNYAVLFVFAMIMVFASSFLVFPIKSVK